MNETEDNYIRDKRERLVTCVLSGNSKHSAIGTGGWGACAPTFLEIAVVTLENNAAQKNFLCHPPPPPHLRYNFLPTVVIYLGKEYTEQQINGMDCNNVNTLINRYESVLSAQMTKSLGKSVINLYSNVACSLLGVGNQQGLSDDLECDPFLNTAMQLLTCNLYYRFGSLLAPVSVGIITCKHYAKNSSSKLNDRNCDPAKSRNCNQTEEPSEN